MPRLHYIHGAVSAASDALLASKLALAGTPPADPPVRLENVVYGTVRVGFEGLGPNKSLSHYPQQPSGSAPTSSGPSPNFYFRRLPTTSPYGALGALSEPCAPVRRLACPERFVWIPGCLDMPGSRSARLEWQYIAIVRVYRLR